MNGGDGDGADIDFHEVVREAQNKAVKADAATCMTKGTSISEALPQNLQAPKQPHQWVVWLWL